MPPDRSGVADYTAATCSELGRLVELHVFTETANPSPVPLAASVRPLDALPCLLPSFDRVVGVLGNSHFHLRIFELLQTYGAAIIAHDARMLSFYRIVLGEKRAIAEASRELGRVVTPDELSTWLADESELEALFLGEIASAASPMIVHSPVTAELVEHRYDIKPVCLPFSIYRPWTPEELTKVDRAAARLRLNLPNKDIVIASFGYIHPCKAPEECIWALEILRRWKVPASLHFVGSVENLEDSGESLLNLAERIGVGEHVKIVGKYVSEQTYRDYLVGADLAIQLRTYRLGGLSGALLDCAAAGLPTVSNAGLAKAVGVPGGYIRGIPDALSPLLLAEALAELVASGMCDIRPEAQRREFSEQRSFRLYSELLCNALHLETVV
jgi:glycosyltransferase involved in cell wall biosynthesis